MHVSNLSKASRQRRILRSSSIRVCSERQRVPRLNLRLILACRKGRLCGRVVTRSQQGSRLGIRERKPETWARERFQRSQSDLSVSVFDPSRHRHRGRPSCRRLRPGLSTIQCALQESPLARPDRSPRRYRRSATTRPTHQGLSMKPGRCSGQTPEVHAPNESVSAPQQNGRPLLRAARMPNARVNAFAGRQTLSLNACTTLASGSELSNPVLSQVLSSSCVCRSDR